LFAVALAEQEHEAVQVVVSFVRYRAHVRDAVRQGTSSGLIR
jgi:hypothetical protein